MVASLLLTPPSPGRPRYGQLVTPCVADRARTSAFRRLESQRLAQRSRPSVSVAPRQRVRKAALRGTVRW